MYKKKRGKYGGDNKNGKYSRDKVYWKNENMVVTKKKMENMVVTNLIEKREFGHDKIYRKTKIWSWQNL